jgi:hypothetical protein
MIVEKQCSKRSKISSVVNPKTKPIVSYPQGVIPLEDTPKNKPIVSYPRGIIPLEDGWNEIQAKVRLSFGKKTKQID